MSTDGKILGDWDAESVRSFLASEAVEELLVTLIPVILGGNKMSLSGLPGDFLPQDLAFRLKEMNEVEGASGAMQLHYVRDRKK
jgi:riboflavin biosynthesis pyrimidine reductase